MSSHPYKTSPGHRQLPLSLSLVLQLPPLGFPPVSDELYHQQHPQQLSSGTFHDSPHVSLSSLSSSFGSNIGGSNVSLPPPQQLNAYSPRNFPYSPIQLQQQTSPKWALNSSPLTPRHAASLRGTGNEPFEISPNANRISQQQQQLSSSSSSSSFRNPWAVYNANLPPPQSSAAALSISPSNNRTLPSLSSYHHQQQSQLQLPGTSSLLQQGPSSRASFSHNLPTTYEYDNMAQNIMHPPSRGAAPKPFYNDLEVSFNDLTRRSSVAVPTYSQQDQYMTRRDSLYNANTIYQQQSQNVISKPAPKMNKVTKVTDLTPHVNNVPKYRRASTATSHISPLVALTIALSSTFTICRSDYSYKSSRNPRRVLTKPSEAKFNDGFDNEDNDYILYVNDVLGVQENKKYMVLDILGKGAFGQVVKCQDLKTQELVAVKLVKSNVVCWSQSLTETNILEMINKKLDPMDVHHFVRLKDKFVHKNHFCTVLELLSSNLYELLKQNSLNGLQMKLLRNFSVQLVDSLCILKENNIIHCDLKPENILLVSPDKPELKVIDFGFTCHERQIVHSYVQSRFYRAPEVLLGLAYSTAIDIWSLGCIVAELFLGLPLFPGTSGFNQLERIVQTLEMPPNWMCEMGMNTLTFMNKYNENGNVRYEMKSVEQYSAEQNVIEKKPKKYFADTKLADIIMNYRMPKKLTESMLEKEINDRKLLVDFLFRCFDLNPLTRWSLLEARDHPFLKGEI